MVNMDNINFPPRNEPVRKTERTRPASPSSPPKGRKEFKNLMDDEKGEGEVEPEESKQSPYALASLEVVPMDDSEGEKSSLAGAQLGSIDTKGEKSSLAGAQLGSIDTKGKEGQLEGKGKGSGKGGQLEGKAEFGITGQQDSQFAGVQIGDSGAQMQPTEVATLSEKIVDQLTSLQSKGEMKTTITIKHPPVLEGATITLSETNTAPKQLNISFAGLSPQAMALLNSQANRVNLTNALAKQGIVVHIVTMTEQNEAIASGESQRGREDRGEEQEGQQQGQDQDDNPSEEPNA
jgi:hypothetical protein